MLRDYSVGLVGPGKFRIRSECRLWEHRMERDVDREIEAWSQRTVRDRLALLWEVSDHEGVRTISYWERDPWSSDYVVSSSQAKRRRPGTWWAFIFASLDGQNPDSLVFSDEREAEGPPETISDAWELRRLLDLPGIEDRPELSGLLISLGRRRDDLDLPTFMRFAGHEDRVVRYASLGVLSWHPGVSNQEIGEKFRVEADPLVGELALSFAAGRLRRKTYG